MSELVLLENPALTEERGEPVRVMKVRKQADILKLSGWVEVASGPDPEDVSHETSDEDSQDLEEVDYADFSDDPEED